MTDASKQFDLRIQRYDPKTDTEPRYDMFEVPVKPRMTVLDALFQVLEKQDPTAGLPILMQERCLRKLRHVHQRTSKTWRATRKSALSETKSPLPHYHTYQ